MLDIDQITKGDARHCLSVLYWLQEHQEELEAILEQPPRQKEVSAEEIQPRFHHEYTELRCMRFVPMAISIFTDEGVLEGGGVTEPSVLLYQPLSDNYVVADYFHTLNVSDVTKCFGIVGHENTWRLMPE